MTDTRKILVVGGYGVFGGRLVDLLQDEPRLTLVVAGRSHDRAAAFCSARADAKARLVPASFDRQGDVSTQLAALAPDVCVDASGPFQDYGAGRYRLIEACIARRIDYLDLADGSDFVAGVSAFDVAAKEAGVFVLSGVSSFPVLTAAVTRRLSTGMASVTSIKGGIAPSPYARVGENVIRAIATYAGQPVAMRRRGRNVTGHPFTDTLHFTIAPPGLVPLKRTLFSLVDVPDLRVLADLWPDAVDVWMGAGPVPELLHRALIALAWLVRWRLVPSLSPLAPLMYRVTNRLRWGEHRGGMFVEIDGRQANGEQVKRSWHLLADGDDGPLIPSMAVEAIVRKALAGQQPAPGARAAVRELELSDYEALFARRKIHVGVREDVPSPRTSLYARILSSAWSDLPTEIRAIHDGQRVDVVSGRCAVQRGSSLPSTLLATCFGFPAAGDDLPVTVRFTTGNDGETWTRTFGGKPFASRLRQGSGGAERLLCECLGPFEFAQALVVDGGGLRLVMRRWSVFGVPLPLWFGPRSNSSATVLQGRYRFFVEISHPLTGLIVRYQGWLEAQAPRLRPE
jgi:hypothetical protein